MSFSAGSLLFKNTFGSFSERKDIIHIYYIWIWVLQ